MAKDQLLALTADVDRLLAAGAAAAGSNETLRKRSQVLRDLSQKVPAIKPVADAVDKVLQSSEKQAGSSFLDLTVMSRQLRASLSGVGIDGAVQPVPRSGPWQTPRSVRDLYPLQEALTGSGSGREEKLKEGLDRKATGDLRLLSVLLDGLNDGYAPVAEMVMKDALPSLGKGVVQEVVAKLDVNGKTADTRRLKVVCQLDPATGADLCRKAIKEGSVALRVQALELLPDVADKAEAEKVGLELCQDKSGEVRAAAILALRSSGGDEALEAVLAAARDRDYKVSNSAAETLKALPHRQTTPRLLQEMQGLLTELGELKVPKKGKEQPAKKGKGKGSKKPAVSEANKVKQQRAKTVERIRYLLDILAERQDSHRAEAARVVLPLVEHKETDLRVAAYSALGGIGGAIPEVLPALTKVLQEGKKNDLTRVVARALAQVKPAERAGAFDLIVKLAKDPKTDGGVRREAILMLPGHWKGHESTILPLLRSILKEKDRYTQNAATEALGEIGPEAQAAVPEVLHILEKGDFYYHQYHNILPKIDPEGMIAIPALIEMLSSRKSHVTWQAMQALSQYGTKARAAIPEVTRLLEHKEYHVQHWARSTLSALEGN
jgi:HEAT repeat protein